MGALPALTAGFVVGAAAYTSETTITATIGGKRYFIPGFAMYLTLFLRMTCAHSPCAVPANSPDPLYIVYRAIGDVLIKRSVCPPVGFALGAILFLRYRPIRPENQLRPLIKPLAIRLDQRPAVLQEISENLPICIPPLIIHVRLGKSQRNDK